jgi:hypothetical protein
MSKKPERSKSRKAPATERAAPARTRKQTPGEPKRKVSEIRRFISRWHWLEADQTHRANLAKTEKESERLIAIHNDEQEAIESQLTTLVPTNYLDACYLLEFATVLAGGVCMVEDADVAMLKNVSEGLRLAWGGEIKAARNAGMEEMRRTFNYVTERASKMIDAELDIRRSA